MSWSPSDMSTGAWVKLRNELLEQRRVIIDGTRAIADRLESKQLPQIYLHIDIMRAALNDM